MARAPRLRLAGGLYHVTARGNRRQPVFVDDSDREQFLHVLGCVVERHSWRCHAYCLMPNHYHAVLETPNADISIGMQRLNARYAQWFNWRHELSGHLFQGRFHAALVESTAHLLELSRYLVLNPVRAGLCLDPGAWRWSSYRAMAGTARPPAFLTVDWLLRYFGADVTRAQRSFAAFVADAPALIAA